MEMEPEYIALIVAASVVGYVLLGRRKIPEQKTFVCSRCSKMSSHTHRTINAWREQWLSQVDVNEAADSAICVFPPNTVSHPNNSSLRYIGGFTLCRQMEPTR
jgi:hypothetical protein